MDIDKASFYKMIAPRPTVCVCTATPDGTPNIGPYSFVTPVSFDPPLVAVSVGRGKDTILNARDTKSFVIAPLTDGWKVEGVRTEVKLPREESEFESVGLTVEPSVRVDAPSVKESPINIECEYWGEFPSGDHILLVGEVVHISGAEDATRNGRINLEDLGGVGHVTGEEFCISRDVTVIDRE